MRFALIAALCLISLAARAQSLTAFTYQGELKSDGVNYSGAADLRFRLFDSASGGSEIGPQVTIAAVPVSAGRFTTMLDFGPVFQSGVAGYIEMDVRTPAGSGAYVTLADRQRVDAAPLAQGLTGVTMTAAQAATLDQDQTGFQGFGGVYVEPGPAWQSFTAGRSGRLTKVEVKVSSAPIGSRLTVNLRRGLGLSGPVIASAAVEPTNFTVQPLALSAVVTAGEIFTMEFIGSGGVMLEGAGPAIAGATGWWKQAAANWWFRTFVGPLAALDATTTAASALPWSGLTGVPAAVANPALVFSKAIESQPSTILSAPNQTSIVNSAGTFSFQSGTVMVNWSLSCYSEVASTGFQIQVRVVRGGVTTLSTPTRVYFNKANVHQSFSGKAMLSVLDGSQTVDLIVTRLSGSGGFYVDLNDSLSYTIVNLK